MDSHESQIDHHKRDLQSRTTSNISAGPLLLSYSLPPLNNYSSKLFVIDDYCILYHKFVTEMLFFYPYTKVSALILQGWPSW